MKTLTKSITCIGSALALTLSGSVFADNSNNKDYQKQRQALQECQNKVNQDGKDMQDRQKQFEDCLKDKGVDQSNQSWSGNRSNAPGSMNQDRTGEQPQQNSPQNTTPGQTTGN